MIAATISDVERDRRLKEYGSDQIAYIDERGHRIDDFGLSLGPGRGGFQPFKAYWQSQIDEISDEVLLAEVKRRGLSE
jgi:hypothetical protein